MCYMYQWHVRKRNFDNNNNIVCTVLKKRFTTSNTFVKHSPTFLRVVSNGLIQQSDRYTTIVEIAIQSILVEILELILKCRVNLYRTEMIHMGVFVIDEVFAKQVKTGRDRVGCSFHQGNSGRLRSIRSRVCSSFCRYVAAKSSSTWPRYRYIVCIYICATTYPLIILGRFAMRFWFFHVQ